MPNFEQMGFNNSPKQEGGEDIITLNAETLEEDIENALEDVDASSVEFEGVGESAYEDEVRAIAAEDVKEIFSKAEELVEENVLMEIAADARSYYEQMINARIEIKKTTGLILWENELERRIKENKDRKDFIENAANNFYTELKDLVEKEMERRLPVH